MPQGRESFGFVESLFVRAVASATSHSLLILMNSVNMAVESDTTSAIQSNRRHDRNRQNRPFPKFQGSARLQSELGAP